MAAFLYLPERPAAEVACSVGQPLCMPLFARSFALCAQTPEVGQRQDRQNARGLGESRALLQGVQLGQLAETLPVPTYSSSQKSASKQRERILHLQPTN